MQVSTQLSATIKAKTTSKFYSQNWPAEWHVIWYCIPLGPLPSPPPKTPVAQIEWTIGVERQSQDWVRYHISVKNATTTPITIEVRFAILNLGSDDGTSATELMKAQGLMEDFKVEGGVAEPVIIKSQD